jgi:hypothetical protein
MDLTTVIWQIFILLIDAHLQHINMTGGDNTVIFEKVVIDLCISLPNLGYQNVISVLFCAYLCCKQSCSTFAFLKDKAQFVCQRSKRKATCMEQEEAFRHPGSRMFQRKVRRN